MKRIYKYPLKDEEIQWLSLPLGSRILSAITQGENIVIYVLVDINETLQEDFFFAVYGTGHNTMTDLDDLRFLNTVEFKQEGLVFHVFHG